MRERDTSGFLTLEHMGEGGSGQLCRSKCRMYRTTVLPVTTLPVRSQGAQYSPGSMDLFGCRFLCTGYSMAGK